MKNFTSALAFSFLFSMFIAVLPALAEDGVSDSAVKLGASIDSTGPQKASAIHYRSGAEMYFKRINGTGGVHKRKIEYVVLDDGFLPQKAAENTKALIETQKVFAIVGSVGTATSKAVLPFITKSGVPFVGPIVVSEDFTKPVIKNVFVVRRITPHEANALANSLVEELKITEIGVLRDDSAAGSSAKAAVDLALSKKNLKIKAEATFRFNSMDVKEAFEKLYAAKPKAVIINGNGPQTMEFVKLASKADWKPILAVSNVAFYPETLEFYKKHGFEAICSGFTPDPKFVDNELVRQYVTDAKSAGREPDPKSLEGYLNAAVFTEALKRAGSEPTRAKVIDALETMNKVSLSGFQLNFSHENHQGLDRHYLLHLKNGQIKPL